MHALGAIVAKLDLAFGIPHGVGADDRDERQIVPHGRVELRHVEAERAVADHCDDRRFRFPGPRRHRERNAGTNGARDAIDDPARRLDQALSPLCELTAVAEEHGIWIALDDRLQRLEDLNGVKAAVLALKRRPAFGAMIEQTACFAEPLCVARGDFARALGEREGSATSISEGSERQTAAKFLLRACDQRWLGIDADQAARRRDDRRLGPLECEIERLAEEHDQIGPLEQLRKRSKRRIADAARAFHDDDGGLHRLLEFGKQRPAMRSREMRRGNDQRRCGLGDRVEHGIGQRIGQRG